jgi:uncharacterized membrane protein YeaQ/YmgE (transglycosylase-associated protein family)
MLKGWRKYRERGKYSLKSSLAVAFISTILLWWLPIFGPAISGYVAGRVSGSKYRGILVTAIAAGVIGAVSFLFTYVISVPASINYYLSSVILYHINIISPYGAWFASSIGQMFTSFTYYLLYFPPNWAVLIAFGFIGGSMSQLLVRETERKTILPAKHYGHDDAKALTPKEVDYSPEEKPHPLLKKIIKEKDIQDSSDDYI